MRRLLLFLAVTAIVGVAGYQLLLREAAVSPSVVLPRATATIGSESEPVAVGADGSILGWLRLSEEVQLPRLPLASVPASGRLAGPVLEQALVLGAAPPALRPYLEGSEYGETGVDVELRSGIELRFGDASQAARKWRAAAAVLAEPSVTALDYVNLHAPRRPTVGGSGHALPPIQ